MIEVLPESEGVDIGAKLSGTITDADYQSTMPGLLKRLDGAGPMRLLMDWEPLDGWEEDAKSQAFWLRLTHRDVQ